MQDPHQLDKWHASLANPVSKQFEVGMALHLAGFDVGWQQLLAGHQGQQIGVWPSEVAAGPLPLPFPYSISHLQMLDFAIPFPFSLADDVGDLLPCGQKQTTR